MKGWTISFAASGMVRLRLIDSHSIATPPSSAENRQYEFSFQRKPLSSPKGFSLSIQIKSTADAERIFHELARDGRVVMPLEKTFWADRFGMVVDRFGIPWLINCEGSDQHPGSDVDG
jgi:hypothetical protein